MAKTDDVSMLTENFYLTVRFAWTIYQTLMLIELLRGPAIAVVGPFAITVALSARPAMGVLAEFASKSCAGHC